MSTDDRYEELGAGVSDEEAVGPVIVKVEDSSMLELDTTADELATSLLIGGA